MKDPANDERLDIVAAALNAQLHPRPPGVLPHHLRCDFMQGKERCRLGENHPGQHEYKE